MIAIYTGPQPQASLEGPGEPHIVRSKVPTWVPESHRIIVEKHPHFSEWQKGDACAGHGAIPIYVGLSAALEMFLAGQFVIDKIRRVFPACSIDATCPAEFAALLPGGVRRINYRDSKTDYYRQFQLTLETIPNNNDLALPRLAGWQRLMLIAAGLWEAKIDNEDQGWIMPGAKSKSGKVVIITEGMSDAVTVTGIGDALLSALGSNVVPVVYDKSKLAELIETVRTAETVIHCGDSPLCYLSAALGIRTLTFKNTTWTKDFWDQYAHYANVEPIEVGDASGPDELAGRIVAQIASPAKLREIPKALRNSSDLIDDETPIADDVARFREERRKRASYAKTEHPPNHTTAMDSPPKGTIADIIAEKSSQPRRRRGPRAK